MKKQGVNFWLVFALVLAGGALINLWAWKGEARIAREPLRAMPKSFGEWKQIRPDARFDQATESVLRADDYVLREYALPDGQEASLYVGYYSTQRVGATYHSPLNCMPGSGWNLSDQQTVSIQPSDGSASFEANAYIIQNASERHALIYWYQGRGRAIASEYRDKIYTVWDSMRLRRSDGSMVRVLVPIKGTDEEALKLAVDLASKVSPELSRYVPN